MPNSSILHVFAADLITLANLREDIYRKFFSYITKSTSCLHHLLPDLKMDFHNSRLRLRSYKIFQRLNDNVH